MASELIDEFRRQELRREGEVDGVVEYGCDLFRGEARELGVWVSGRDRAEIDQRVLAAVEDVLSRLPVLVAPVSAHPAVVGPDAPRDHRLSRRASTARRTRRR